MDEREDGKKKIINRLRTIKGHVQGIEKMVEEEKGCEDILVQVAAIKQSIHKVGLAIMEQQASTCFTQEDQVDKEKMEELIRLMFNYSK